MANPTTNYGFVLPTSSDLVTDLPADFDVALQGVDTRLKALQPGTTLGDLAYSSATANTNTRLGVGTTGQVLTVAGGVPSWATPAAGGGMTEIATGNLTGSTTIRIQSIPSTYKSLQLVIRNHIATSTNLTLRFRLNNDSTANRYASAASGQSISETYRYDSVYCTSDGSNTTAQGMAVFTIHNYTNTTTWKMFDIMAITNNKTVAADIQLGRVLGAYNQTGAVNELDIFSDVGNWTGGTYILYGVN